jgi:hypothetical protein
MPYTKDRSIWLSRRWTLFRDYPNHIPAVTLGGNVVKLTRSRVGDSVKDWKTKIRLQQNATSAMSGTFDTISFYPPKLPVWHYTHLNFALGTAAPPTDTYFYTTSGAPGAFGYIITNPVLGLGTATNRATIAFLKHARKVQSEFSSPIFLGELKETLQMIRSPAKGIRNILNSYVSDIRKRKKKQPKEWKKNLSSAWLETVFGVLPLVQDLEDGYKAYSDLVKERDNEQVLVSGYGIEEKVTANINGRTQSFHIASGGVLPCILTDTETDKAFVKIKGMVVRRVDATLRDKLARVGFNLREFIPTVWELIPWSFLVDYFTNIGDVLEASAFNQADLAWVDRVSVQTRTYRAIASPDYTKINDSFYTVSFTGEPVMMQYERRLVIRSPNVSLATPSFAFELPGKPAQFANMLALFAQANSVHPQRYRFR